MMIVWGIYITFLFLDYKDSKHFTRSRVSGDFFMAQVTAVIQFLFKKSQSDSTGAPSTERVTDHHTGNSMPIRDL